MIATYVVKLTKIINSQWLHFTQYYGMASVLYPNLETDRIALRTISCLAICGVLARNHLFEN